MKKEQLRAWVLSVLAEGITKLEWCKASGWENDNQLRNFLARPKAGMQSDSVAKLQAGLKKLRAERGLAVPEDTIQEPDKPQSVKSPKREALAFYDRILALCEALPEEVHAYIEVDELAADMKEILGHMHDKPKKALKKTG
jgi:hypothetical protein